MLISTEIHSFKKYGTNEQVLSLLKEAGFEAYDFSMFFSTPNCFIYDDDYLDKAKSLRAYADKIGIVCNQAHAPFPVIKPTSEEWAQQIYKDLSILLKRPFPSRSDDKAEYEETLFELNCRALKVSGTLGAKCCVIHPFADYDAKQNANLYNKFKSVADEFNVKIAVENMWNYNDKMGCFAPAACSHHLDFKAHVDLLDDTFVACLDLGHAELSGLHTDCTSMILTLGDRLKALHVHDNNFHGDDHALPYTSKIDFNAVTDALAQIGYDGDITFEAEKFMPHFEVSFYPKAARHMYDIGDYIRQQIITKKAKSK